MGLADPTPCAGYRVLVVDDNVDARDLLSQALTYAGATVWAFASAGEAIASLDDVDIVVTDYSMPGNNGLWLLERARERRRPVPVIVVTGFADVYARELARAPFARTLHKPIDPWTLCRAVGDVLRGQPRGGSAG